MSAPTEAASEGEAPQRNELELAVEALLLAAQRPLSLTELQRLAGDGRDGIDEKAVRAVLERLERFWQGRSCRLRQGRGGYRLLVDGKFSPLVARLQGNRAASLPRAQLEVLALVAWQQPISSDECDRIRRTTSSAALLNALSRRGWVQPTGRTEGRERLPLYATTARFLDDFQLDSLSQLPALPEEGQGGADSLPSLFCPCPC